MFPSRRLGILIEIPGRVLWNIFVVSFYRCFVFGWGDRESTALALPCLTYGSAQAQAKDMEPASIERLNEKQKQSKYLYF